MSEINFTLEIILPVVAMWAMAWVIPSLLFRFLTESITGLIVNGIFSSTIMIAVGIAYLYLVISNPEVDSSVRPIVTFASRSLSFALLWAPILILNLITRPQYWKT
ncbi:MAG: hypothetical protein RMX61_04930 [Planktomarina sp.]|nr:hypothetical protein [Planktomarina sp.]